MKSEVQLMGQVRDVRKHEDWVYTRITLPAESPYESPAVVEVRSKKRLGQPGEEIQVSARVGGYLKRFSYTDKATGEQVFRSTVTMYLDEIPA